MAPTPRTFTDVIDSLRFGELGDELTAELQKLTLRCDETKRAGSITLTIKLKPGKGGQVEVVDEVKTTMPKMDKGTTLMFATVEGNLSRNDPRQRELDGLRQVEVAPRGEVRSA